MIDSTLELPFSEELALLRELNHRINNEFACVISTVTHAAVRSGNEEVKAALTSVCELLHRFVEVHRAMERPEHQTFVDAAAYLDGLCASIGRSRLDQMEIKLVLAASPLQLQSDHCWRLGMIVYELITNSARHAFANRSGEIRVELCRSGSFVECRVLDNGSAQAPVLPGRGLKVVSELAKTLAGKLEHQFGTEGARSILTFPWCCEPQTITYERILPIDAGRLTAQ